MLRNIVFDMGQVLISWSPERLLKKKNIPVEDWGLLKKAFFETPEWVLADWGRITVDGVYEHAVAHLPERLHEAARRIIYEWYYDMDPMPGMCDLLDELKKKGYGLYMLSNATARLVEFLDNIPGFSYMDGYLVSGAEKLLKPDPAIYSLLCSRYGLKPEECLFVDDLKTNCAGARMVGMKSYVFSGDVEDLGRHIKALTAEMAV